MALVVAEPVAEVADTGAAEAYTTGSFTPAANSLLVAFARASATVVNSGVSDSVDGAWDVQLESIGANTLVIYSKQMSATPSARTVTFACTGDPATGCFMMLFEVTGHNIAAPVPQAAVSKAGLAAVTPNIDFGSNLNTNNAYLVLAFNGTNPIGVTGPSGFTDIASGGFGAPNTGYLAGYRVGGLTGTNVAWDAAGASAWGAAGIEVAIAGAAAVTIRTLALLGAGS